MVELFKRGILMNKDFLNLDKINKQIEEDVEKVILTAEENFREQLFKIANKVMKKKNVKLILMAGPSCAGKTTSARLLTEILNEKGKKVISVEMDSFFRNLEDRKLLPDGSIDFDSIDCVNLEQMQKCFKKLFENGSAMFPIYDFVNGKNIPNKKKYTFDNDTIIIFEGIHVLNPELTKHFDTDNLIKIYISNYFGYKNDELEVSTRQFRLCRRMIRDKNKRGVSPSETLDMWGHICTAEHQYIVPFKKEADFEINSSHSYEMGLYKHYILDYVKEGELSFDNLPWLKMFEASKPVSADLLPETTLMNEFIIKK